MVAGARSPRGRNAVRFTALCVLAACHALPPPPVVAFHGDTAAAPADTTTAMLVVGVAGQVLGGGGVGVAVRVERQQTDRTTVGLELTGGKGSGDGVGKHWLAALRAYGRGTPRTRDWVALTYGLGLSVMDVGLVTFTAHAGGAVSYPNDYVAPFLGAGLALALPIVKGEPWGDRKISAPCFGCSEPHSMEPPEPPDPVKADLYIYGDAGAAFMIGDKNRLSIDAALVVPTQNKEGLLSLSLADGQRFVPD